MWRNLQKSVIPLVTDILTPQRITQNQLRTTFVLKRRHTPLLHKAGYSPKRLRNKYYIYDLVKDENVEKQPNIDVILTTYVDGVGDEGEKVSVRPHIGYNKLILTGLAVYASPENLEKYKSYEKDRTKVVHSTATAQRVVNCLSRQQLEVVMNKENPWTLKAWHVKTCFRKCGYHVPEEAITMPTKSISGPNMDLEGKQFYVTVTINNQEKVNVKCVIHHWSTDILERVPQVFEHWKQVQEPIFPEDVPVLDKIPSNKSILDAVPNTV